MAERQSGPEVQKETQGEAPISEWGIGRVEQRLAEIVGLKEQMKEPLPEKEFEELLDESHQLNARKKELLSVGTREAVNIARLIKDGTLRNEDMERAFKRIEQTHPDDVELQEANFDLVRTEHAKLEKMVKEPAEVKIDLGPLVDKIVEGQRDLLREVEGQRVTFEQFLKLSQRQTQNLADSLRRLSPEREQERWVDVEYKQEFYTKFTPTLEPRFYTELPHEERELFEARWQLARAAYWKKAYSAFPEKQFENQDLQLLRMEQMERLYSMVGVREALEWYAEIIKIGKKVEIAFALPDGTKELKKMSIWECKDEIDFERFREAMRDQALKEVTIKDEKGKKKKVKLDNLKKKEADAVAWNWIWCSNLVESMDSRYVFDGGSGGRHDRLPGVLVSDDLRSTFHPQEKYEDKCRSRVEWGAFGKWGVTQIERIARETHFDGNKDKIEFQPASNPSEFWEAERTKEPVLDKGKLKEKGEVAVRAPECYPTTSMKSFWEETDIKKTSLLDYLVKRSDIPWREAERADPWIGYLPIKLRLAVGLFEYFKPGKQMKEGEEMAWVGSLRDQLIRLRLEKILKEEKQNEELGEKAYHNLKVWAVYGAFGGTGKPHKREATAPLDAISRTALENKLRSYQLGLLKRGLGAFTGEALVIT